MKPQITRLVGQKPGKAVAIFCGVHGNERVGIMVVNYLQNNLVVEAGTVYLVKANPRSIGSNVRFTEKNLNRCFVETSKQGHLYEEKLATQLMNLLDSCDALLDLHSYNEPSEDAIPFIITEENAFEVIESFNFPYVLTGIDAIEKGGTDGYMYNQGKIGICCELGAIEKPENYFNLGIETALSFLSYFKIISIQQCKKYNSKTFLKSHSLHKKQYSSFTFTQNFKTFDHVSKGTKICFDGPSEVCAEEDLYILFPNSSYEIGTEAFLKALPH